MHETPDQRRQFTQLAQKVVDAGGVLTLPAEVPKKAWGGQRLGANIRGYITIALEARDIGHIPLSFPDRESDLVRLYKRDSAVGRIIEAALSPGIDTDKNLIDLADGVSFNGNDERLDQIRQLLGALQDVLDES
jgi:hypothetical protein